MASRSGTERKVRMYESISIGRCRSSSCMVALVVVELATAVLLIGGVVMVTPWVWILWFVSEV